MDNLPLLRARRSRCRPCHHDSRLGTVEAEKNPISKGTIIIVTAVLVVLAAVAAVEYIFYVQSQCGKYGSLNQIVSISGVPSDNYTIYHGQPTVISVRGFGKMAGNLDINLSIPGATATLVVSGISYESTTLQGPYSESSYLAYSTGEVSHVFPAT